MKKRIEPTGQGIPEPAGKVFEAVKKTHEFKGFSRPEGILF